MSGRENEKENERNESGSLPSSSLPPNFSQLLDKVLANPEIIGAVASALSGSGGGTEKESESESENENKGESAAEASVKEEAANTSADVSEVMKKLPDLAKLLSAQGGRSVSASGGYDRRAGLLSAIKPYMNPHRCEAIDRIIGFSHIADVLKNFK